MWLRVGDVAMPVAQVGGGRLVLCSPCDLPPDSEGKLFISVDGHKKVYHVILPQGASKDSDEVKFF